MQASCRSKKTLDRELLKTALMQFYPLTPSLLKREIATVKAFAQLVFANFVFNKPLQIAFNPLCNRVERIGEQSLRYVLLLIPPLVHSSQVPSVSLLTGAAVPPCGRRFLG